MGLLLRSALVCTESEICKKENFKSSFRQEIVIFLQFN